MKRTTLDTTRSNNEVSYLKTMAQKELELESAQREFERKTEEYIKDAQKWVENAKHEIKRMQEEYDSKTYYENEWKITEMKSKDGESIIRMKSKIEDGARLIIMECIHKGQKVYQTEKIECITEESSYTSNVTIERYSEGCGWGCLGILLMSLCILAIIILAILGLISLF